MASKMPCNYAIGYIPPPGYCAGPNERAEQLRANAQLYNGGCSVAHFVLREGDNVKCVGCIEQEHCGSMFQCIDNQCILPENAANFGKRCYTGDECAPLTCIEGKCAACKDGETAAQYFCYSGTWRDMPEYAFLSGDDTMSLVAKCLIGMAICETIYCMVLVWFVFISGRHCRQMRKMVAQARLAMFGSIQGYSEL